MYSVEDEASLDRISEHWLPLIRQSVNEGEHRKPVVLVGNKIDLIDYSTIDVSVRDETAIEVQHPKPRNNLNYFLNIFAQSVLGIMEDFPEVESCVECSAKTLHNISEMFYYAQKAVLHPAAPLYSMEEQDVI